MTANLSNNLFAKDWTPFEDGVVVSVRCPDIFGDDVIRRGKICGWHICTGLDPDRQDPFEEIPEPSLEYEIRFFKTQRRHWVPVECITGFMKGISAKRK